MTLASAKSYRHRFCVYHETDKTAGLRGLKLQKINISVFLLHKYNQFYLHKCHRDAISKLLKMNFIIRKKETKKERQKGKESMAVWYVNRRTAPWLWHHFQMVCQLCCHAQISAWPWSSNITCVNARTLCPVGKYTVRPDRTLISTTHQVISALWSTGKMRLLTLHFWLGCEFVLFLFLTVYST